MGQQGGTAGPGIPGDQRQGGVKWSGVWNLVPGLPRCRRADTSQGLSGDREVEGPGWEGLRLHQGPGPNQRVNGVKGGRAEGDGMGACWLVSAWPR